MDRGWVGGHTVLSLIHSVVETGEDTPCDGQCYPHLRICCTVSLTSGSATAWRDYSDPYFTHTPHWRGLSAQGRAIVQDRAGLEPSLSVRFPWAEELCTVLIHNSFVANTVLCEHDDFAAPEMSLIAPTCVMQLGKTPWPHEDGTDCAEPRSPPLELPPALCCHYPVWNDGDFPNMPILRPAICSDTGPLSACLL